MHKYCHILVAVELMSKNDVDLINRAKEFNGEITLIHAVENVGSYNLYGVGVGLEVEKILFDSALKEMRNIGKDAGIKEEKQIVKIGPAKFTILEEADRVKADLIVVGSHGKHGLRALLGSTANAVLHGAKCDVLAVRVKN